MAFSLVFAALFIFIVPSHTSFAADTLSPNQNLTDGQYLVSSNQRFVLGFFPPGNNSGTKYLGIWYNTIHSMPFTVVWVANRDRPLNDSSGFLTMTSNGSLLLHSGSMGIVWSAIVAEQSPILQLLGTGNLVVRKQGQESSQNDDDYVWQSFDHMSNTMLPGMKLGWNLKTRTNNFLRSWKSSEDPSDGEFTFELDSPTTPQLILRSNTTKKYRWGPFDGDRFSGSNPLEDNTVFKPIFVANTDEVYYAFEAHDDSVLLRCIITLTGEIQYLTWRNGSTDWSMADVINRDYCDKYGLCGPYGTCYSNNPNCRCLQGFVPSSPRNWQSLDTTDGCKRRYDLNCSNGDGFVRYHGLKLPDNSIVWADYNPEECRAECLKNCSCMGYSRINVLGNGDVCVVWLDQLVDVRNFPNQGETLYIRMARAELDSIAEGKRRKLISRVVGITVTVAFLLVLLAILGRYIGRQKRKGKEDTRTISMPIAHDRNSDEESQDEDLDLPIFDLATIFAATDQFSYRNKIGQGGFGPVYKGELSNGVEIAVKRLSQSSGQGLSEFKNEVILIAKLQHRNLVRLLGCCIQEEEKMLVYEYLPNKSLDNFIFDRTKRRLLPWDKRFSIIVGIAKGLLYLHQDSRLRIIHRDLKTSNILLDREMNPKISDFGIARIFGGEQTEEKTRRIIGTYGYMSPEYAMGGHFSTKSDVFSFGVIVLEVISGFKNWAFYHPDHEYNLIGHSWKLWNEKRSMELVDEILDGSFAENEIKRCIQVALLCVQQRTEDRPTMSAVVFMLSNENVELPVPNEPGFYATETSAGKIGSSSSGNSKSNITGQDITFTTVEGR